MRQGEGTDTWTIEGDGVERIAVAFERIAAALELLASPIKRDNERRAAMAERDRQLQGHSETELRAMGVER